MTAITLLPGVDEHGAGYRVRLSFKGRPHIETGFATAAKANARALELRELRAAGLEPAAAPLEQTLREAAESLLARKRTLVSRKTRRPLRARGLEWWDRILRPWLEGDYAELPVSMLRRDRIETFVLGRAAAAAKTAGDELYGLKAVLRYAGERGAKFDQGILAIEPIATERRRRLALGVDDLELLAEAAPDYARRMLLFAGTVGNRVGELFTLTDDRVDLAGAAILIPAELCKEAADKWIDLTREEVALLREQLLARAPGTRFVFPTKTGLSWAARGQSGYGDFHRLVWAKACRRAADAYRLEHGLAEDAPTPFDDLEPHDLRATAATLMRDAGFTREEAAHRLGHADSGKLLDRLYDQGDRRARVRSAIAARAPEGLRARAQAEPDDRGLQPAAAVSAAVGRGLNPAPNVQEA